MKHKLQACTSEGDTTENKVNFDFTLFSKEKAMVFTEGTNGELFSKTELNVSNEKNYSLTLKVNGRFVIALD